MRFSLALAALAAGFTGFLASPAQAGCTPSADRYPRVCSQGDCYYVALNPTAIIWWNC